MIYHPKKTFKKSVPKKKTWTHFIEYSQIRNLQYYIKISWNWFHGKFIFCVIIFTNFFFSKHTTCWYSSPANTSRSWHVANDVGVWPDYRYYYHVASDTKKIKDLIMLRISPIFLLIIIIAKTKILHKRSSKIYS